VNPAIEARLGGNIAPDVSTEIFAKRTIARTVKHSKAIASMAIDDLTRCLMRVIAPGVGDRP
jgi:hypothetical protein